MARLPPGAQLGAHLAVYRILRIHEPLEVEGIAKRRIHAISEVQGQTGAHRRQAETHEPGVFGRSERFSVELRGETFRTRITGSRDGFELWLTAGGLALRHTCLHNQLAVFSTPSDECRDRNQRPKERQQNGNFYN
jgi:hypothetical protein